MTYAAAPLAPLKPVNGWSLTGARAVVPPAVARSRRVGLFMPTTVELAPLARAPWRRRGVRARTLGGDRRAQAA